MLRVQKRIMECLGWSGWKKDIYDSQQQNSFLQVLCLFFFNLLFWLLWVFVAGLGLSPVAASWGCSLVAPCGLLVVGASPLAEHGLRGCSVVAPCGLLVVGASPLAERGLRGCSLVAPCGLLVVGASPLAEHGLRGCSLVAPCGLLVVGASPLAERGLSVLVGLVVVVPCLVASQHEESPWVREQSRVYCIGRQIPNH